MDKLLMLLLGFADKVIEAKSNLAIVQSAANALPEIILEVHNLPMDVETRKQIEVVLAKYIENNFTAVVSGDLGLNAPGEGESVHEVVTALSKIFVSGIKNIDSELQKCYQKYSVQQGKP